MTENDIIKALECCVNWGGVCSCANCPLYDTGCIHFDKLKETLDLIKRQKAEIERLTKEGIKSVGGSFLPAECSVCDKGGVKMNEEYKEVKEIKVTYQDGSEDVIERGVVFFCT